VANCWRRSAPREPSNRWTSSTSALRSPGEFLLLGKTLMERPLTMGSAVTKDMVLANIDDMIPRSDFQNRQGSKGRRPMPRFNTASRIRSGSRPLSAQADAEWEARTEIPPQ